jgi:hypothetical protein
MTRRKALEALGARGDLAGLPRFRGGQGRNNPQMLDQVGSFCVWAATFVMVCVAAQSQLQSWLAGLFIAGFPAMIAINRGIVRNQSPMQISAIICLATAIDLLFLSGSKGIHHSVVILFLIALSIVITFAFGKWIGDGPLIPLDEAAEEIGQPRGVRWLLHRKRLRLGQLGGIVSKPWRAAAGDLDADLS